MPRKKPATFCDTLQKELKDEITELLDKTSYKTGEEGGLLCRRLSDGKLEILPFQKMRGRYSMDISGADCNKYLKTPKYEQVGSFHTHPNDTPVPSQGDLLSGVKHKHGQFCIAAAETRVMRCYEGFDRLRGDIGTLAMRYTSAVEKNRDEWVAFDDPGEALSFLDEVLDDVFQSVGVKRCQVVLK